MITQTSTSNNTSATVTRTARTTMSRLEVAGILLLMAGEGYINGNFMQPINVGWGAFIDAVHFIPLAILLWLGVELLRPTDETGVTTTRRRGARIGVTILAALAAITCVAMIALGVFAPSLGVGAQAFSDWLAVILAGGGAVMWFMTLFQGRRVA
ncbi:MAG TPA: hypothetical protein VE338_14985 [Ktedonobacterales bacterium]|jgi:hypothetical protein|nr:hypothetical protein [Ktedonobacterales bacterium]